MKNSNQRCKYKHNGVIYPMFSELLPFRPSCKIQIPDIALLDAHMDTVMYGTKEMIGENSLTVTIFLN